MQGINGVNLMLEYLRSVFFWYITQRIVIIPYDVSGQSDGTISRVKKSKSQYLIAGFVPAVLPWGTQQWVFFGTLVLCPLRSPHVNSQFKPMTISIVAKNIF